MPPTGSRWTSGYEPTARSIWPSIYPPCSSCPAHRSTIVFVNNRRLAERLAIRSTSSRGARRRAARAHHGSLAREQRVVIEETLKAGRIPCLVATSSLELGIDMGAVDLVIQVESPKSVRAGCSASAAPGTSWAPSRRVASSRSSAPTCSSPRSSRRRCGKAAIEETAIPRNPLDVLAQHVVAICADEDIAVTELHELVRGAHPFAELSRQQLENVLDMLAGRYPSDEFAELRPRTS